LTGDYTISCVTVIELRKSKTVMESSDRKNVYLTKAGDNSLNSGMRETMIVGQTNMAPGTQPE